MPDDSTRVTPSSNDGGAKGDAAVHGSAPSTRFERCLSIFAKSLRLVAYVAIVYGLLALGFFLCCGVDPILYASPSRSPFGSLITVLLVWPVLGLLCLAAWGVEPRDVLKAADKSLKGLLRGLRPPGDT
jgi:hypothetical protein